VQIAKRALHSGGLVGEASLLIVDQRRHDFLVPEIHERGGKIFQQLRAIQFEQDALLSLAPIFFTTCFAKLRRES
jgi:hypothetical protein